MDDAAAGEGWRQSGTTEGSPLHTPRGGSGLAKDSNLSSLVKSVNHRAEAIAEAHRSRIEAEAQAYLDAATRKAEARAQRRQANAERQRMHEESKALEARKREEQRAEQIVHFAELKAEINEAKKKELAEIVDRVQQLIVIGQLPVQEHRGVVRRMKESLSFYV
ncbi:hypothetical protein O6H91_22G028800 [Diphasiastrum complanatum]|uniref:Uncharacterized protein n=1 Tax=Diphasiastrum complanatum TaxID=34168 RepID=A0ACC2AEC1_DIPCM|nr:hypothetical protein O6H91_22G028800 [Diphasiastrum complanatum]